MRRTARSWAAALGLLVVVVGVPLLLYSLGGGLPTSLPSAHQVHNFFGQPITDTAIVRGVSFVCWAVWVLFVVAVVTEAAAWVRQRPSPSESHRGFRVPGLQGAAGALFLTAVLLLPQRSAGSIPSGPRVPLVSPAATAPLTDSRATVFAARPPTTSRPTADTASSPVMSVGGNWIPYTVERYDTPWGIAEAHLGNGLRWREIKTAEGGTLATDDYRWVERDGRPDYEQQALIIYAGQRLWLPPDATGLPATAGAGVNEATSTRAPVTAPPSTSWPAPPPAAPTSVSAKSDPPAAAPAPHDPETVRPSVRHDPEQVGPATEAPAGSSGHHDGVVVDLSAAILAAGLVASAALITIGRLRKRQSRMARPGQRIRLPDQALAKTELALRVAGREHLIEAVHRGTQVLADDLARSGADAPHVCGVLADENSVEMLLDRPHQPPSRWEVTGDGYRWRISSLDLPSGSGGGNEPLPLLVPLGCIAASGQEALINLDAAGMVEVRGGVEAAAGLVHAAAISLTGTPWAKAANIVVVGFGNRLAAAETHIRSVARLEDIAEELQDRVHLVDERFRERRDDRGRPTSADAGELVPTVLLIDRPLRPEQLSWLRSVCSEGVVSAVFPGNSTEARWAIEADADQVLVPELRVAIQPTRIPSSEWDSICELIDVALDTSGATAEDPPYNQLTLSGEQDIPVASPVPLRSADTPANPSSGDSDWLTHIDLRSPEVVVKVLGQVELDGAGEFRRPRSREIALYLTMHPKGVSEGKLDEMIWPTRHDIPASTRDPAVSAARSALGGPKRFPYSQGQGRDKRYRLTELVGTDWQRFCLLHRAGRQERSPQALLEALELIRGRPFGDLDAGPGYEWLHVEGHIHHMEAEISDAAELAAELLLGAGEPVRARRAVDKGLLGAPYAERLWVQLMAVADALGEAQEVERILADMDGRLGLDGDFDQLHPDTVAAYRRYSRARNQRRAL
jgi:DNA-binding SARP family transcriptional activator